MNSKNPQNALLNNMKPFSSSPGVPPRQTIDEKIWPWSSIGLLEVGNQNASVFGSGFMYAPDVIVTAKHNFTQVSDWDAAGVWLEFNSNETFHKKYDIYPPQFHSQLDLAIAILADCNVNPLNISHIIPSEDILLGGYGVVRSDGSKWLTYGSGKISKTNLSSVTYLLNTNEGDSGAPIIIYDKTYKVIGIHTQGLNDKDGSSNFNHGILLTQNVISDINNMISAARNNI
ncbi:trypsin-like serine peptidase [Klebsiella variicola]